MPRGVIARPAGPIRYHGALCTDGFMAHLRPDTLRSQHSNGLGGAGDAVHSAHRSAAGDGDPCREQQASFQFVTPPRHVAMTKALVEGVRRRAPWVFVCLAPIKPLFSGMYYGWINRHERVMIAARVGLPELDAPYGGPAGAREERWTRGDRLDAPSPENSGDVGPSAMAVDPESAPAVGSASGPAVEALLGPAAGATVHPAAELADEPTEAVAGGTGRAVLPRVPAMPQEAVSEDPVSEEGGPAAAGPEEAAPEGATPAPASLDRATPEQASPDLATERGGPPDASGGTAHVAERDGERADRGGIGDRECSPEATARRGASPAPAATTDAPGRLDQDGRIDPPASDGRTAAPAVAASARPSPPADSPVLRFHRHLDWARQQARHRRRWEQRAERTAMVIGTLGPGGAERQLLNFAREFERRGHGRCRAITIREPIGNDGHHLEALQAASILDRSVPLDLRAAYERLDRDGLEHVRLLLPAELCGDVAALLQAFRRIEPSVVHAWLDWSSIVAGLAAMLLPVRRIILSTRNVGPHNFPSLDQPYFAEMYRVLLRDPRVRLLNNSTAGAEDYAAWLGIPPESIHVVRNGIDTTQIRHPSPETVEELRRELAVPESAKLVAGVFRLAEEKQPLVFVEVAERIMAADPDVVVVHAGSGVLDQEVRRRVECSPHSGRFRLLGRRHDVPALLAASSICLLTSRKEGTPNVLIESQHLGCPVVAARAGGAPETFQPGRTGLLCEVGDVEGLAGAALRLLRDEPLRRSMARRGPSFVRDRFSLSRMFSETTALYD